MKWAINKNTEKERSLKGDAIASSPMENQDGDAGHIHQGTSREVMMSGGRCGQRSHQGMSKILIELRVEKGSAK